MIEVLGDCSIAFKLGTGTSTYRPYSSTFRILFTSQQWLMYSMWSLVYNSCRSWKLSNVFQYWLRRVPWALQLVLVLLQEYKGTTEGNQVQTQCPTSREKQRRSVHHIQHGAHYKHDHCQKHINELLADSVESIVKYRHKHRNLDGENQETEYTRGRTERDAKTMPLANDKFVESIEWYTAV